MKKWIRHERPNTKNGLFIVWYDFGNGKETPSYMNSYAFDVAVLENKFLEDGFDMNRIEDFKQAVTDMVYDNAVMNGYDG